jgi:hypothetical protein
MKIGHAGIALLVKRARPRISLPLLIVAAYGCDIVEILFRLLGHDNRELSHSLISVGVLATVMAGAYFFATRRPADAAAVWVTYVLHWPADFITGKKPTWPGGPSVGLMFYSYPLQEALFEILVLAICLAIYLRAPRRPVTTSVT